jgi:hypothetical protein
MPQVLVITGILLTCGGAAIPGGWWIELFRPMPGSPMRELLLSGSVLFRAGLAALGLGMILASRMPAWRRPAYPAAASPWPERQSHTAIALLLAILAAAFALRLYKLDLGLWYDEVLTYVFYARMPFGEIVTTYHNENQHFIFTLAAHACFLIFGEGAWALRFPAVMFGVASLWALYLVARQVGSTREALFAAAVFGFSYHHVWFSQNARGYSGLLFWTLFTSWLLLRALRENRPLLWLAYAVSASLGVYTHITMLFVIAGQGIAYLARLWTRRNQDWPGRWDGLALGFTGAGLLTFAMHGLVLPQILAGMGKTVSVVDAWKKPLWTMLELFRGLQTNLAGAAVAVVALAVFAAGVWSFARKAPIVLTLLFVPPLAGAALVLSVGHHLWPRFFFFAFGFGVLVAIRGAMVSEQALRRFVQRRPAPAIGILCSGMVLVSAASVPFAFGPKQDYLGAMAFVEAEKKPGDAVLTAGLVSFPYQNLYKPGWQAVETLEQLNKIRAASRRTLVLSTLEPVLAAMQPDIARTLKSEFRLLQHFPGTLQNGTVYVYISEKSPGPAAPEKTSSASRI